jgi:hypothetical protein
MKGSAGLLMEIMSVMPSHPPRRSHWNEPPGDMRSGRSHDPGALDSVMQAAAELIKAGSGGREMGVFEQKVIALCQVRESGQGAPPLNIPAAINSDSPERCHHPPQAFLLLSTLFPPRLSFSLPRRVKDSSFFF